MVSTQSWDDLWRLLVQVCVRRSGQSTQHMVIPLSILTTHTTIWSSSLQHMLTDQSLYMDTGHWSVHALCTIKASDQHVLIDYHYTVYNQF